MHGVLVDYLQMTLSTDGMLCAVSGLQSCLSLAAWNMQQKQYRDCDAHTANVIYKPALQAADSMFDNKPTDGIFANSTLD